MRSRERVAVGAASVVMTLGACSLTTNLDGLSGGGSDGGGDTAATADAADGVVDGFSPDGIGSDATTTRWCEAQDAGYRLCSDFDVPSEAVTQGFDRGLVPVQGGAGGNFTVDTSAFLSPPAGALGLANPFPAGGTTGIRLVGSLWPLGATPSAIHCKLGWRPRQLSTTPKDYAHVFQIALYASADESDGSATTFSLNMQGDGGLVLLEYYPNQLSANATHVLPGPVIAGAWLDVDVTVTTTTYTIRVGTAAGPSGALSIAMPATSHGTFEIGPAYFGGATTSSSPGWLFGYDDVVCY